MGVQHVLALILLRGVGAFALGEGSGAPGEVQVDIARGVDSYIKIAKAAKEEALVEWSASTARKSKPRQLGRETPTMDPRWAAPAIAEAWCYATISLSKGYLNRLHAEAIIAAIEAFTSSRS